MSERHLPDATLEDIMRWHQLHRDPADQTWRIVDELLREIDDLQQFAGDDC